MDPSDSGSEKFATLRLLVGQRLSLSALYEESLQLLLHMTRRLVTKGKEIDFRTVSATLPIHNWDARWGKWVKTSRLGVAWS